MTEQGWTRLFIAAAIFNLLVGLPLLIDPAMGPKLLPLPAGDFIWPRIAGGLIVMFGIGYFIVSRDLDRNRGIIGLGVAGKLMIVLILLIYWVKGTIRFWSFSISLVDLAFALLFLRFLTRYPAR
jgi:hypothetical protein